MTIGLREANQQFAKVVRALRAGRDVTLTDRGRPLAVIRPVVKDDHQEALLRRLEEEGVLARAKRPGPMPAARWRPLTLAKGDESMADIVSRDRDEHF